MQKSSVEEIRARFDSDVERFSRLETGQSATMDAPLVLDLIAQASAALCPDAKTLLDVGCGAGNYSLKLLQALPSLQVTLVDLSLPMLERARQRIDAVGSAPSTLLRGDIRDLDIGAARFDLIIAAAVLHHLRSEQEWESVFRKFFAALKPGGAVWISDLVEQTHPALQRLMWSRFGDYLTGLKGENYRDQVFAYIDKEDSPRPLMFQLDLLRRAGFQDIDLLHKNACFAAFGGRKPAA
jgi:tRNA (cmo5U34)-methyltransferase